MGNPIELMSLFWTTSGVFGGLEMVSRFDFRERVEAAARAGFKGIGLWHTDLEHITRKQSLKEMKRIMDDNDIRYLELEFLTDWFLDGPRKAEVDLRKRMLLEASEALGAKHVKIGDFDHNACPLPQVIEAFSALCREAQDYGATIGFELMGCAMIDNLKDALTLVESAGAKNGGLILDIVQVMNLGIPYEAVRLIPQPYLIGVELNDGTLPGSPNEDPSRTRRWCGEGEYDIRGFIRSVQGTGFAGPWAVEVMSQELAVLPLDELNRLAFTTTMAQFQDL
jgi:sugar phosphate isomerase/epimerase